MDGVLDLVIFCIDTNSSKNWYEKVGFEYLRGHDDMHWFKVGNGELMLHPTETQSNTDAVFQIIVKEVDTLFEHILEKELNPLNFSNGEKVISEPTIQPWGYKEFCLKDPDGYIWTFVEKV